MKPFALRFQMLFVSICLISLFVALPTRHTHAATSCSPAVSNQIGSVAGLAYAGEVDLLGNTRQPLLPAQLDCSSTQSQVTNAALSLNLGSLATVNTAQDTVSANVQPSTISISADSTIQNISLFGGRIQAKGLDTFAQAGGTASTTTQWGKATFASLSIGKIATSSIPLPNTNIALPGIGNVTLNKQVINTSGNTTQVIVTALDVQVTQLNLLSIPVGTHIQIGHVEASFTRASS
jgi:hypothetical protein